MDRTIYRIVQAFITLGLAGFLTAVLVSGRISWYIHARFSGLVVFAALCLTAMAGFTLYNLLASGRAETGHHHDAGAGGELVILAIPLVLALLVPAAPLSSVAVETRGAEFTSSSAALPGGAANLQDVLPEERTLLDWMRLFGGEGGISPYIGQKVRLTGFVYRDDESATDRFMLGRFIVTCCVADAFPVGFTVESPQASTFAQDEWVEIHGTIAETTIDGKPAPLIQAETVRLVQEPKQPYLYP